MAVALDGDELIANWTLVEADWPLIGNKAGATRLGFTLLLLFYASQARFPTGRAEIPDAAVAYVGEQVRVDPGLFNDYRWSGRTIEYHRSQIRRACGFREPTVADEAKLADWLARDVCGVEFDDPRRRAAVRCIGNVGRVHPRPGHRPSARHGGALVALTALIGGAVLVALTTRIAQAGWHPAVVGRVGVQRRRRAVPVRLLERGHGVRGVRAVAHRRRHRGAARGAAGSPDRPGPGRTGSGGCRMPPTGSSG